MENLLNKSIFLINRKVILLPFYLYLYLFVVNINLFSQNEYSTVRFPYLGNFKSINHNNIFIKDTIFKSNFRDNGKKFSQNNFICDNDGNIILQYIDNKFVDSNFNIIINGDYLINNNINLLNQNKEECFFIKDNYNKNEYYCILLNSQNNLMIFKIRMKDNYHYVDIPSVSIITKGVKAFTITHHFNHKDYWIIIKSTGFTYITILINNINEYFIINQFSFNDNYYYDVLDCQSIDPNDIPIESCVSIFSISPDGKKLVFFNSSAGVLSNFKKLFQIIEFNNQTGTLFNNILFETNNIKKDIFNEQWAFYHSGNKVPFEFVFSPSNKFLYLIGHFRIYLIDLKCLSKSYIENSIVKISDFYHYMTNNNLGLIFFTNSTQSHNILINLIDDIHKSDINFIPLLNNNPNNSNSNFKFLFKQPILDKSTIYPSYTISKNYISWNLKNNVVNSTFYQVRTDGVQDKCEGDDFYLDAEVLYGLPDTNYRWTGPNGFTSNIKNPFKNRITKKDEGVYTCEVFDKKNTTLYKGYIDLVVNFKPVFKIVPSNIKLLCSNDKVRLNSDQSFKRYLWSNGDTTRFTWINKAGTYSLTAFNSENECSECSTTQTITLENAEPPIFDVVKDGEECGSSAVKLRCDRDFPTTFTYLWNTGATTAEISATINGVYTLTVTDTNGCKTSKSVTITFGQKPIASISATGPTTFCEGGKVELRASGGINSNDLFFKWSSGETVPNITVTKSGVYRVVIKHKFSDCVDSAEIEIKVNANLECNIVQNNMLCKGREITLTAEPQGIEYTYLWSTGATTSSIIISQGGRYSVEISLDNFCKSSSVIDVIEFTPEVFEIIAIGKLCIGEIVTLSTNKDFASYEWSTGENTKEIAVTNSGVYSVTAIDLNGCVSVNNIEIILVSPKEYNLDFTDYDFGDVEIGAEKRVKFNITGEVEMQIKGDFTYDMNTNEMVFKPTDEKSYSGEIVIDFGGDCDTTATILLVGRGVNSLRYKAKVIAPTIDTEAGLEDVELPFTFNISRDDLIYPFLLTYKLNFEINADVYLPNFATTIMNNKRVVELTGTTNIIKGENIIVTILGKTFLSEFIDNPINIIDFEHNLPKTDVEQIDGNIKIVGVCTQNLRIIQFRHLTKLNITPNPASDNILIKVSTAEKGTHKLFITSITGTKKELSAFVVGDDIFEKTFDINLSDLPDGTYILELQTPNQSLTEKVLIVR